MTIASAFAAKILSPEAVSDDAFFEATELLSTRLRPGDGLPDLRSDVEAPELLFDWFRHAESRVPDLRVWNLSCQVDRFFDPAFEPSQAALPLPEYWPWDTRDRVLAFNEALRSRAAWVPAFEAAAIEANEAVRRWLDSLSVRG